MKRSLLRLTVALFGVAGLTACINHESNIVRDPERVKVQFENDTAARIFYEALAKTPGEGERVESTTTVEIPILFEHKRHVIRTPNDTFNRAVERCDLNKDGKITEEEAKHYAEQLAK